MVKVKTDKTAKAKAKANGKTETKTNATKRRSTIRRFAGQFLQILASMCVSVTAGFAGQQLSRAAA